MATFYNFTEGGKVYSFDNVFLRKNLVEAGELFTAGDNSYGQIGDNTTSNRSTPTQEFTRSTTWVYADFGYDGVGALKSDGTYWGWGDGAIRAAGDNTTSNRLTPRQEFSSSTNWKQVCVDNAVIAVKGDGSIWAWGQGPIGDNTTSNRNTPVQITIAQAGGLYGWKQGYVNATKFGAIRNDGTLWMWGRNNYADLGDGTTTQRLTPRQISILSATGATGWKYVSCGYHHTAALRTDGTIWSWGRNHVNQLGNNSATNSSTPVQEFSSSTNWKYLDCGRYNTLAIKEDGSLWVWGYNGFGQLGVNDTASRPTPVPVWNNTKDWQMVASGDYATGAIKTNGELWVWGSNGPGNTGGGPGGAAGYGVLGTNDTVQRNTPVQTAMGGTNWKHVSFGWGNMVAIKYSE